MLYLKNYAEKYYLESYLECVEPFVSCYLARLFQKIIEVKLRFNVVSRLADQTRFSFLPTDYFYSHYFYNMILFLKQTVDYLTEYFLQNEKASSTNRG